MDEMEDTKAPDINPPPIPEPLVNGYTNGTSSKSDSHRKHKHKDKDREKDRHGHKHKNKDKDRDKDKSKDRHSSSHKHNGSDRKKDEKKDKHKESHDKERSKDSKEDKDGKDSGDVKCSSSKLNSSSSRDKERDAEKEKRKEKEKEREKRKDKQHGDKDKSSRHKDKDKSSKDHREKDSKEHKEKDLKEHKEKDLKEHKEKDSKENKGKDSKEHKGRDKSSKDGKDNKGTSSKDKDRKEKDNKSGSSKDKSKDGKDREDKKSKDKNNASHHSDKKPENSDGSKNADRKATEQEQMKVSRVEDIFGVKIEVKEENRAKEKEPKSMSEGSILPSSQIKEEPQSDDSDVPLAKRMSTSKRKIVESEDEEDLPLIARKKVKKEKPTKKRKVSESEEEYSEDDYKKKKKSSKVKKESKVKTEPGISSQTTTPTKKKKGQEEEQEVWKWWEEEKKEDGVKWHFLEHKGPMFSSPYEPLPSDVHFYYNGKSMKLSENAEEVATFYAKMIEHDYTTKKIFNDNFFKDWRRTMTSKEREVITDLKKCDFKEMHAYFIKKSEERKAMSKEEKKKLKEQNDAITKEYGVCVIDGHKEKIGNFRIEPPGLFRGRGEHPKMGKLKKRVMPEDVIINCSKDSKKPKPPKGHKWKEIRCDNTVTWLANWTENVQGQGKYVMLNPSSKLKGEKDMQKYEIARKLHKCVDKIRQDYREDFKSKEMRIRQRAVAMYFIDRLALRAGNEKDEEQADTVGCCSLRVEHIQLFDEKDGKEYVVVFDFLGKDSIRYYNEVPVEKRVYRNLKHFCENKKPENDLFDRLNTAVLNKHLNELMEGLTAKVFRTYNASITLQNQLNELTDPDASIPEKILQYNRANRAVAILCNHQRAVPKSHDKSMENIKQKIETKRELVKEAEKAVKEAKRGGAAGKAVLDTKKKKLERLREQLMKLEVQETDKEENKTIALGTSKLNYLDPRISVAWCKKYGVPIEKVYNKTQQMKFRWAIEMAGPDYVF